MPRELPGFYWNEAKNRYFPLSSKPPVSAPNLQTATSDPSSLSLASGYGGRHTKRRRINVLWDASETARVSVCSSQRRRCMHEVMCSHLASTSRMVKIPVPDPTHASISAFKTTILNGRLRMFYGDMCGWLYSFNPFGRGNIYDPSNGMIDSLPVGHWVPDLNFASEISSISISDSKCIVTSFGPACKIFVQDIESSLTFILNPGPLLMHDIWTSHLQGRNLAIAANKKAIFLKDIDTVRSLRIMDTQSDVFAVEQQENLVYTGARNGSITRFDTRLEDQGHQKLLDDVFTTKANSVTHLKIVRDWQLIVGNVNGSLATYDLRFARGSSPLLTFSGHQNSYTLNKLALAVDPSEDFLFVAGQDKCIRAWSLQSGQALLPPPLSSSLSASTPPPSLANPLHMKFSKPVVAMQITEERDEMCLWAASDKDLFKYYLGPGPIN